MTLDRARAGASGALPRLAWLVGVVALSAPLALALIPLDPAGTGLDQSWRIGLTTATLDHLVFGRDIIFTYGPLGYVLEGAPVPALAAMAVYTRLLLLLVAVCGAWSACSGRSPLLMRLAFLGALLATAATLGIDYVAFAGVLALLARAARYPRLQPFVFAVAAAVGTFGLLAKQTLGLDVLGCAGAYLVVQLIVGPRRRRRAALASLAIVAVVTVAGMLWAFGGSMTATATYLLNSAEIVGGFSSAMALPGSKLLALGAFAIGVTVATSAILLAREGKAPFAAAAIVAVFLAWKHGFAREDLGHTLYFFAVAALVAPLAAIVARRQSTSVVAAFATMLAYAGGVWMLAATHSNVLATFTFARIAAGASYVFDPAAAARGGEAITRSPLEGDRLAPDARARIGNSSVEVIPSETAIVAANQLRWDPAPVFQSYSAYTPRLDALNHAALATRGADVELLRYEDIDGRYPFSAEPATFAELVCRYRAARWTTETPASGAFLVLVRVPTAPCSAQPLGELAATLNSAIAVPRPPHAADVVRAAFDLRPSLLGSIASALWRAPAVWIEATYRDGTVGRWRFVAPTAADGVIVSPMPRNQDEARRLFAGASLPATSPVSVRVIAPEPFYRLRSVSFSALRRTR